MDFKRLYYTICFVGQHAQLMVGGKSNSGYIRYIFCLFYGIFKFPYLLIVLTIL